MQMAHQPGPGGGLGLAGAEWNRPCLRPVQEMAVLPIAEASKGWYQFQFLAIHPLF
ncbi:hypothetical protein [Pseudoroseomonas cervicalis]|uniref:hypothetical protein n=1 Tax=Teichococcus cervicalis TaxID=204525 RepID=UPI00278B5814|nr:hypothetical protein [Pseudoroseomonas cervicalis]MDQ1079917.1 hypothetical protein [Pseudoroseomonas cervicalis]